MNRLEKAALGIAFAVLSAPAFAGEIARTPAPVAGVGIGAVLLLGIGYRALKHRIHR